MGKHHSKPKKANETDKAQKADATECLPIIAYTQRWVKPEHMESGLCASMRVQVINVEPLRACRAVYSQS